MIDIPVQSRQNEFWCCGNLSISVSKTQFFTFFEPVYADILEFFGLRAFAGITQKAFTEYLRFDMHHSALSDFWFHYHPHPKDAER